MEGKVGIEEERKKGRRTRKKRMGETDAKRKQVEEKERKGEVAD